MICPNCDKNCEDGSTFCPHCEAVLDASILGDFPEDTGSGNEDTPLPAAPPPKAPRQAARAPKPAARPRRRAPIDEEPREPAPEPEPEVQASTSGNGVANKYSQYWVDDDPPARKPVAADRVPASPRSGAAARAGEFETDSQDPGEIVKEVWAGFLALHFEDKLTAISATALFLSSFMPWRTTPDGDDLGFLTWGIFTVLAAGGAIAAIWARKTGKIAFLPAPRVPLLSLGAGIFSVIVAAIFALTAFEHGARFGQQIVVSQPAAGVFLSILASAGVIVGSILTGKRER